MDVLCLTRFSYTSAEPFTDDDMGFVFHGKKRVRACHVVDFYVLWCAHLVFCVFEAFQKESNNTPHVLPMLCPSNFDVPIRKFLREMSVWTVVFDFLTGC